MTRKPFDYSQLPQGSSKVLEPCRDILEDEDVKTPMTQEEFDRAERYRQRSLERLERSRENQ